MSREREGERGRSRAICTLYVYRVLETLVVLPGTYVTLVFAESRIESENGLLPTYISPIHAERPTNDAARG